MSRQKSISVTTAGEGFADGTAIDLVRDDQVSKKIGLIVWNGSTATRAARVEKNGVAYLPLTVSSDLLRATQFPTGTRSYGTTRQLFDEISALVTRTNISIRDARLVPYFVLADWFAELLPVAPFLWVNVAPTASAASLRNMLTLLCRRPILYADLTVAEFRSRPSALKPTIFADLRRPTGGMLAQLAASNQHGVYRARNGELIDGHCAKVVFAGDPLRDPAAAGFPLEITMTPTRQPVGVLGGAEAARIAEEFQAKLEMYRLANFNKVASPKIDVSGLTAPMQDLAITLASPIIDDAALQAELLSLLTPRDEDIRLDRTVELAAVVIEVLLGACHDPKVVLGAGMTVTEFTRGTNTILDGRGGNGNVAPESVGWILRRLQIPRTTVQGGLHGVVLDHRTREQIHELAESHGVLTRLATSGLQQCAECLTDDRHNAA